MATLEELKAANRVDETAAESENVETEIETTASPQAVEDEKEVETVEDELEETTEDAESEEKEASETDTEDWKQGDSHESQAEKKFTDGDVGKAKANLRAKLDKRHEGEVGQLREEIEQLKKGSLQQSAPADLTRPKRDDFFEADDQDEAYFDALTDWKLNKLKAEQSAEQATQQTTNQMQQTVRETEQAVDQHYERAVSLAEKSGISAEQYQSADFQVRQMIESLYPKGGDSITDALIASLGEGSEKVFYNLGVNSNRLAELKSRLEADKSGVRAAMYLGSLNSELTAPQKRKTAAPKPAPNIKGDEQNGSKFKALKKAYEQAHKSGNRQEAFNARREAKKAGADTSKW